MICGDSIVRLVSLNECVGAGGNALYHGRCSGYVFVPFLKDWELPFSFGCLIRQKVDDMVESGSKLVSDFTSEQDQVVKWRIEASDCANFQSIEPHHARFEINLGAHSVIPYFERAGIDAELIDVLYGPFNLGPRSI